MSDASQNIGCWFEIAVSDLEAARKFYSAILEVDLTVTEDMGPNPVVFFPYNDDLPGVGGHLYPGKPSREGATIHMMVSPGLDAARQRVEAAGGTVESPDVPIPAGSFFYARDPDGNSIGLFNLTAAEVAA